MRWLWPLIDNRQGNFVVGITPFHLEDGVNEFLYRPGRCLFFGCNGVVFTLVSCSRNVYTLEE